MKQHQRPPKHVRKSKVTKSACQNRKITKRSRRFQTQKKRERERERERERATSPTHGSRIQGCFCEFGAFFSWKNKKNSQNPPKFVNCTDFWEFPLFLKEKRSEFTKRPRIREPAGESAFFKCFPCLDDLCCPDRISYLGSLNLTVGQMKVCVNDF